MSKLFSPGKIGTLELKNKLIMTAVQSGMAFSSKADFLVERAKNDAAMVTMPMGVHASASHSHKPIVSEENMVILADIATKVGNEGCKLCVQLFHVGRNAKEGTLADKNALPVAPSPIPSPIYRTVPKELSATEIDDIYLQFANAAILCKQAGVHALEISCSAGYLLSLFLSEKTNQRNDIYGGSKENRFRFPLKVIESVRNAVGKDYPIILRISGSDMLGGYSLLDMRDFCVEAEKYIDAVNVTGGWHEAQIPQISTQLPCGGYAFLSAAIRDVVKVPVIACNRINNIETAEEILDQNFADFIGSARAFLADSGFARKIKNNLPYISCIGCNKGCIENILRYKPATCIFNPLIGHERKFNTIKNSLNEKQKIMIVGGGPAGLLAAKYLALCSHEVSLYTDDSSFGGTMNCVKKIPGKEVIANNIESMILDAKDAGASLFSNTCVDIELIKNISPDKVILAMGAKEFIPPISGFDLPHVHTSKEVCSFSEEKIRELLSKKICIVGGGASGIELAYYLLSKSSLLTKSKTFLDSFAPAELKSLFSWPGNIAVVEKTGKIGADLGASRWMLMKQLSNYPLTLLTESEVTNIRSSHVEILQSDKQIAIEADVVIFATGYKPHGQELITALEDAGYAYELIGDCNPASLSGILGASQDAFSLLHN